MQLTTKGSKHLNSPKHTHKKKKKTKKKCVPKTKINAVLCLHLLKKKSGSMILDYK